MNLFDSSSHYYVQNPLKIIYWRDRIAQILKGNIPPPITLTLDISNFCNHNCVWCFNRDYIDANKGIMGRGTLSNIITNLYNSGVLAVEFTGGGEPAMNPNLAEALEYTNKAGLESAVVTNGCRLNEATLGAILKYCSWTRISLDAGSAQTHTKLHGAKDDDFYTCMNNIVALVKERGDNARPKIGVAYLIHPDNIKEIPIAAEMLSRIGVDYVHFRMAYTEYSDYTLQRAGYKSNEFLNESYERVIGLCQVAKTYETPKTKILTIFSKYSPSPRGFKKCWATMLNPVIGATGRVFLCCERRGDPKVELGNVKDYLHFWALWYSKNTKAVFDAIRLDDCPKKCKFNAINEAIERTLIGDDLGVNFL